MTSTGKANNHKTNTTITTNKFKPATIARALAVFSLSLTGLGFTSLTASAETPAFEPGETLVLVPGPVQPPPPLPPVVNPDFEGPDDLGVCNPNIQDCNGPDPTVNPGFEGPDDLVDCGLDDDGTNPCDTGTTVPEDPEHPEDCPQLDEVPECPEIDPEGPGVDIDTPVPGDPNFTG